MSEFVRPNIEKFGVGQVVEIKRGDKVQSGMVYEVSGDAILINFGWAVEVITGKYEISNVPEGTEDAIKANLDNLYRDTQRTLNALAAPLKEALGKKKY